MDTLLNNPQLDFLLACYNSFPSELKHPHIVKFYGTAVINEKDAVKAILVMELCKGNLREYLQTHPTSVPGLSSNKNDVLRTFQWVAEICAALDYIHGNGIVHMDLKLDNILVRKNQSIICMFNPNLDSLLSFKIFRSNIRGRIPIVYSPLTKRACEAVLF